MIKPLTPTEKPTDNADSRLATRIKFVHGILAGFGKLNKEFPGVPNLRIKPDPKNSKMPEICPSCKVEYILGVKERDGSWRYTQDEHGRDVVRCGQCLLNKASEVERMHRKDGSEVIKNETEKRRSDGFSGGQVYKKKKKINNDFE